MGRNVDENAWMCQIYLCKCRKPALLQLFMGFCSIRASWKMNLYPLFSLTKLCLYACGNSSACLAPLASLDENVMKLFIGILKILGISQFFVRVDYTRYLSTQVYVFPSKTVFKKCWFTIYITCGVLSNLQNGQMLTPAQLQLQFAEIKADALEKKEEMYKAETRIPALTTEHR